MINEKHNPYHGIGVIIFFSIAINLGLYFLFRFTIGDSPVMHGYTEEEKFWIAVAFSGIIGFFYYGIVFLACNVFSHLITSVKRIVNFVQDWTLSFSVACDCYALDVQENGLLFPIYFVLFLYHAGWAVLGIVKVLPFIMA
ncbi:MAG: hypothetical protein J6R37_05250 [Clostridia bacterium]|nr:hypothetical protein [Clostridia bacterium]